MNSRKFFCEMNLRVGNDDENDLRADDLVDFITMLRNSALDVHSGLEKGSRPRHVPRNRIYEILKSLKMKSILYSPVVENVRPRDIASSIPITDLNAMRAFGVMNRRAVCSRYFDLVVKSLEHRFSVYGHRVFSAEEEGVVPSPVYCVMVDKWGRYMLSGADDFLIKVWSVETGMLCATLLGHTAEICDMAFSPCMQYLVSLCSEDASLVIWMRTSEGMYMHHRRLVEVDPKDFSKKLTPMFMEFSPSETVPVAPDTLRLVIAYTNGCLVVHELLQTGKIVEFNRVVPTEKFDLKSLALLPTASSDPATTITALVGVSRPFSKSILCYTIRGRGSPNFVEYSFSSSGGNTKSSISHISVANSSSSFVANDDEHSSVYLFRDTGGNEFEKLPLLRGQISGDAWLVDDSSLSERLGIMHTRSMRFSVDLTVFSKSDDFVFCSISGARKTSVSIADDDESEIYSVLIFDAFSGALLGVMASNRDHIFNIGPVEITSESGGSNAKDDTEWAYMFKGSYDGTLEFFKIRKSPQNDLLIVSLTTFNINKDDSGSNRPRSILDCHVRTSPDGHLIVATSDTKGSICVFSTNCNHSIQRIHSPSEQFFHNDYTPIGGEEFGSRPAGVVVDRSNTRTTSIESGGMLCDSRLVPLVQLDSPSLPVLYAVHGSNFSDRFTSPSNVEVQPFFELKKSIANESSLPKGPGRPKLSNEERFKREQRLANLAASRAALAAVDSDEYVRTSSGRIVKRINDRFVPEHELELYENSEIDDSSFTESENDDNEEEEPPSPRRMPSRQSVRIRSRGLPRPPPRQRPDFQIESESPVRSIRVKRKSLKCNHCGTEREVDKATYDEYTSTGKRVRCRWIGFTCEFADSSSSYTDDPISEPSYPSPQRRSSRLRELRR